MKKLLSFVLCVVLIGCVAVPAFAVDATVDYCRVKIVVDGATIVPKDADGKPVEPFIWKGTTYLPVRSVANALGLEVGWEPGTVKLTSGGSRTAAIGKPTESHRTRSISMGGQDTKVTLDGKELALKDAAGNPVTPIISGGVTYLPVRAIADAVNVPVLWDGENATVYLGKAIEWRLVKETEGEDTFVDYTYDEHGNMTAQVLTSSTCVITLKYQYDDSRLVRYIREDNTGWDISKRTVSCFYNDLGQLVSTQTVLEDGTVYESHLTYDERGNQIISVGTDEIGGFEWLSSYDELDRCVQEHFSTGATEDFSGTAYTEFHTYDEGNKRILTKRVADEESEYSCIITYTYDEYGNLIQSAHFHEQDPQIQFLLGEEAFTTYTTYEYIPIYK